MAKKPGLRIAGVSLSHVFGVPYEMNLSFVPSQGGEPRSALIFGENGSGKSSIAKAIEFVVQGRVNRKGLSRATNALNLADPDIQEGTASVTLSDGTVLSRTVTWDRAEDAARYAGSPLLDEFARSPIVLTRSDILAFIASEPAQRGRVFLDYSLVNTNRDVEHDGEVSYFDEEMLRIKSQIRSAIVPVAEHLEQPAPYDIGSIGAMIEDVYKGVPRHRRYLVRLPHRVEAAVGDIAALQEQLSALTKKRNRAKSLVAAAAPQRINEMKGALGDIDGWLSHAFRDVTGTDHITRVFVRLGESSISALDIGLETNAGTVHNERVLSEGYQDLLAMLFFLAIARVTATLGQPQVLILDDVLQSVDAHIRVALMQLVLREFRSWQLIVTVHDRLWREQLHKLFHDAGVQVIAIELRDWTFTSGSRIDHPNLDPSAALRAVLQLHDTPATCALAGRLLEQICDVLSWTVPISVQRKREDRYTLEDLWPGVASALRNTAVADCIVRIQGFRHLRNLVGAHHNEWAKTATWSEARRFADSVLELLSHVRCSTCSSWVGAVDRTSLGCPCGATALSPLYFKKR